MSFEGVHEVPPLPPSPVCINGSKVRLTQKIKMEKMEKCNFPFIEFSEIKLNERVLKNSAFKKFDSCFSLIEWHTS